MVETAALRAGVSFEVALDGLARANSDPGALEDQLDQDAGTLASWRGHGRKP